jgi:hypothetical protein
MSPPNEDARPEPGARKSVGASTNALSPAVCKPEQDWEDRRNAAACFRNQNKSEDWHPAYQGVMVVEGLRDGEKFWVSVHVRTSRKGEKYLSVVLKPHRASPR